QLSSPKKASTTQWLSLCLAEPRRSSGFAPSFEIAGEIENMVTGQLLFRSHLEWDASTTRLRRILKLVPATGEFQLPMLGLIEEHEFPYILEPLLHEIPHLVEVSRVVFIWPVEGLTDFNGETRALPRGQEHRVAEPNRLFLTEAAVGF